jgi:hypothetical protein
MPWAKILLVAGLLLVCAQGLFRLDEVQAVFSPGYRYAAALTEIEGELRLIDRGLQTLQVKVADLAGPAESHLPALSPPEGAAAPGSAGTKELPPDASQEAKIFAAKRNQVYVARKMNLVRVILEALQRSLQSRLATNGSLAAATRLAMAKTLQQAQEVSQRWQIYHDRLDNLSQKLNNLAGKQ